MELVKQVIDQQEKESQARVSFGGGKPAEIAFFFDGQQIGEAQSITIEPMQGGPEPYVMGEAPEYYGTSGTVTVDHVSISEELREMFEAGVTRAVSFAALNENGEIYEGRAERRKKKKQGLQVEDHTNKALRSMLSGKKHWS